MKTQPKTNRGLSCFAASLFLFAGFTVNTKAQPAKPSGSITASEYRGIGGTHLNGLKGNAKFPSNPDHKASAKYFEWPQSGDINKGPAGDVQNNYGWMLEGYLFPPQTGKYCFYLCSDDNGELYLSTDSNPANKQLIATEPQWNGVRNFKGHSRRGVADGNTGRRENISGPIQLTANKAYYIQALAKEGGGGDNLSVAWFTPKNGNDPRTQFNSINPKIIPGKHLAGFDFIPTPGEQHYTISEFLQKDFDTLRAETGGEDFYISGLLPGKEVQGPSLLTGNLCWTIGEDAFKNFKKIKIGEAKACFDVIDHTISASLKVEPAFLKGGSIEGSFTAGANGLQAIGLVGDDLGIPIGTTPAFLQKIGASANDLHLKPGWYIKGDLGVSVGKKKIADEWPVYVDSYATWFSNGYLEIGAELKVIGIITGSGVLRYTPAESSFYAEAWMDMYGGALRGTVKLNARPNYFNGHFGMTVQIPRSIPIVGGINFGGANIDMTITDKYWEVAAGVYFQIVPDIPQICIPQACFTVGWPDLHCSWRGCKGHWHTKRVCTPRICTPAINNSWSRAKFNVRYHSQHGFSAARGGRLAKMYNENLAREPWENPFVAIVEVPEEKAYAIFNDNWDILHESVTKSDSRNIRKQGPVVETIEVAEDLATAIFRISYEKEVDDIDLVLITPDGAELDIHNGPMPFGYEAGAKGTGTVNAAAKEAYYLLQDVKKGTYQMVVGNADALGGTLVELAAPNAIPQVVGVVASESGARDGTVIPNQFDIDWAYFDEDEGSETVVSFFVDKDREGYNGFYVGGGLVSEMNTDEPFTFLTDSLGLRPGWYYTYLEVNDGRNLAERIYSDERIFIDMDNAPDSVEQMATLAGPNNFTVAWDAVADERVDYYNVVYSKSPTFDKIEASQMIYPLTGQTQFNDVKIEGLENGVPYYVAVLSVDGNYVESSAKVIHRVVPTNYPGGTPPSITSTASDKATVGYDWNYRPVFFDGDEHNPELVEDLTQQVGIDMDWTLVSAPNGMEIDEESGLISWKPTADQEGVHRVLISAKEHEGEADPLDDGELEIDIAQEATQEIEINVFPAHLLNGVPYREDVFTFVSDPPLTAVKGTTYSYTPNVFTDGQEYEVMLLNGPKGVTVENNIVKWDVPADAESDFVELRAETDNGDLIDQTYFVHVHGDNSLIKRSTSIVKYEAINGGILIGWTGGASKYQVQRTASLSPDETGAIQWEDVGEPIENGPVNFHAEKSTKGNTGYYRIKDLE